jgi:peptide/nickel transport system substrate-binding protein
MNRLHPRLLVAVLLFVALWAGGACRQTTPPANSNAPSRERVIGQQGGTITYRFASPPKTFNPHLVADEPSLITAFFLLNSRLVEFDHDAQRYVPGLAESWQTAPDGRSVTLKLRDGLKFSDGRPLTSDDVAFTLKALYDERTNSPGFRDALLVKGKPLEIVVQDARNFQLNFPDAVASADNYLFNITVLPRHVLEPEFQKGQFAQAYAVTAAPASIVTCGPFTVEAVTPGEKVKLKRNPHYWKKDANGAQLPYLDGITLAVVPDANNAFTQLGQSSLDVIDRIRPADYAALRSATGPARAYDLGPGLSADYIWFNLNPTAPNLSAAKKAWFNDARFRRAVAAAMDRDTIAATTLQGLATPLYSFVTPGNKAWAATDLPRPAYNLEQAKTLLKEAGFTQNGADLVDAQGNKVEFTLVVPVENEPRKLMAAVVQEDLAKLGIKMQVAPIETQALGERWSKSFDYDAVLMGLTVTDLEPSSYVNLLRSDAATHQWHPKQAKPATDWEAEIDRLFDAQTKETDPAKRKAAFRDIQRIMGEQMPLMPIVSRHVTAAANTRVGNYRPSTIMPFSLWNADELFVK